MERRKKFFQKKRGIANSVFSWLLIFAMVISNVSTSPGLLLTAQAAETESSVSGEIREDGGSSGAAQTDEDSGTDETAQTGEGGGAEETAQAGEDSTEEGTAGSNEGSTEESAGGDGEVSTAEGDAGTEEDGTAEVEETAGTEADGAGETVADDEAVEDEPVVVANETVDLKVHFKNTLNWNTVKVAGWAFGSGGSGDTSLDAEITGNGKIIENPDEDGYYSYTFKNISIDSLQDAGVKFLFNANADGNWTESQTQDYAIKKEDLIKAAENGVYECWVWPGDAVYEGAKERVPHVTLVPAPTFQNDGSKTSVTFYYYDLDLWNAASGDAATSSIVLASPKSGWATSGDNAIYLLKDKNHVGRFTCTVECSFSEEFEYKYVVENVPGNWTLDPSNWLRKGDNNYVYKAKENATVRFHFENTRNWDKVALHYWGNYIKGTNWPGTEVDITEANKDENGYYTIDAKADGLQGGDFGFLFTNGESEGLQTQNGTVEKTALVDNGIYELWVGIGSEPDEQGHFPLEVSTSLITSPELGEITEEGKTKVTFRYQTKSGTPSTVFLTGSWTDWLENPIEMKPDDDGIWSTVVELPHGEYEYKYAVPKEGVENPGTDSSNYDWYLDPFNSSYSTHEENGQIIKDNSLVYVPGKEHKYTIHYYNPDIKSPEVVGSDLYLWEAGINYTDTAKIVSYDKKDTDENGIPWLTATFTVPYTSMGLIGRPSAGSWSGQDSNRFYQLKQLRSGKVEEKDEAELWYIHGKGIYETKPDLGNVLTVSVSPEISIDYTQNKVLEINTGGKLVKEAYVDAFELGISEKLNIDPELMAVSLSVTKDTPLGTVELPVTVVDYQGNTVRTSAKVKVVAKTETESDFDWDEAVIYFMVTDRFNDGDASNNGKAGEGTYNKNDPGLYHGGDFAGVIEKLDYLKDLGVNTIWITPIVENIPKVQVGDGTGDIPNYAAYHGYWASDFKEINGALGTKEEFQQLINAVHAKDMKLMLDVVVNHAGYGTEDSETFEGMLRDVAIEDDALHGGGGQAGLPDFLTENPEVRNMIIGWQVDWANMGVDYFRVDTVKHVDNTTWAAFKNALAEANPQFKMIGEYFDAGYASNNGGTLGSGQMDSLLDFNFNDWASSFVKGGISYVEGELAKRNAALDNTYLTGQFLSSHDENGFKYNLLYDNKGNRTDISEADADAAALVAATLQITAKGQPVIYYGEEIGLTGANDYPRQTNRYDFDWSKAVDSNSTLVHYKKMLKIRQDYSEIFARGDRQVVMSSDDEGYDVISRSYNDETIYVGMNIKSSEKEIEIPVAGYGITQYEDLYSGTSYPVKEGNVVAVKIPAASAGGTVVLVPKGYSDSLNPPQITTISKGKTTQLPSQLTLVKADGTKSLVDVTYSIKDSESLSGVSLDETTTKITVDDAFNGSTIKLTATDGTFSIDFTLTVAAEDKNEIVLKWHYSGRSDNDYTDWNVWAWLSGKSGNEYKFKQEDDEWIATYTMEGRAVSSVGYRLRQGDWLEKDVDKDRFIDLSKIVSGTVHCYVTSGEEKVRIEYGDDVVYGTKVNSATYDKSGNRIKVVLSGNPVSSNVNGLFTVKCTSDDTQVVVQKVTRKNNEYILSLGSDLSELDKMLKDYSITYDGYDYQVIMPSAYSSDEFERLYTYEGDDLGATWTKEKTTFKVWAPTADKVEVFLYESGEVEKVEVGDEIEVVKETPLKTLPMTKGEKGVWSVEEAGDLNGKYYTYNVTIDGKETEACDPYARTTGVNGDRAMVIDLDSTDPEGWANDIGPNQGMSYNDSVIYELHVRDFSIKSNSGISDEHKGKFLGIIETGTTNGNGQSTGLDYLTDLGVTHIHLLPSYDYGSVDETKLDTPQFNWGYDPQNYNVPEGSYSTDPYNGKVRVEEMKQMVKTLHDNNINVIMDVVYNHVYNADTFCFNQLVPKYFSRTTADGAYSSTSGCGNDTASERAMVKKYIVDSVNYWADEYHIDGFRFDLVGLLDTETINEVVNTVHEKHPNAVFYGEGWDMDSTAVSKPGISLARQGNSAKTPEFAFFSDTIRDLLKGPNDEENLGFVSGKTGQEDAMADCFRSITWWSSNPSQIVNYASCHDNYTLKDKLNATAGKTNSEADVIKMNNLAAAIYMTAEGIPLIHAGEEILRTKVDENGKIIHNSYNSSDYVNQIKWEDLDKEEYRAVRDYYKGLIEFRKNHAALRLTSKEDVAENVKYHKVADGVIMFVISGKDKIADEVSDGIVVIFNANNSAKDVNLSTAAGIAAGTWNVCINDVKAGTETLATVNTATDSKVTVQPISAMVLVKGETEDTDSVYDKNTSDQRSRQALKVLIEKYEGLKESDYMADSWTGFAEALAAAKAVVDVADTTEDELNAARNGLLKAYEELVLKASEADLAQLKKLIDKYGSLTNAENTYTEESWSVFADALAAAKVVYAKEDATQKEAQDAKKALEAAYGGLKKTPGGSTEEPEKPEKPVDTTELKQLIDQYSDKQADNYTDESWNKFHEALEAAKEVLNKGNAGNATQAEIDEAVSNLRAAYIGLTPKPGTIDKSRLQQQIKLAQAYTDESKYTEDTWNELQWALINAQEIEAKENATQAEIDAATKRLMDACSGLIEAPTGLYAEWRDDQITIGDDGKAHITYTGKALKPYIIVYDGRKPLKEKTDYTLSYKNNTNATEEGKEATITIKGKGNYSESFTMTFIIDKVDMETSKAVEIADLYALVTVKDDGTIKGSVALKPVVKFNGKTLKIKKDYTAAYVNPDTGVEIPNTDIQATGTGTYTVAVTAVNKNFTGTRKITMNIANKLDIISMSKVSVAKIPAQPYEWDEVTEHGKVQEPKIIVTYGKNKQLNEQTDPNDPATGDYTVKYDEVHTEAGETVTITLKGNGRDYFGEKKVSFKITGTALKAKQVSLKDVPKAGLVYNGTEQRPEVLVESGNEEPPTYPWYTVDYQKHRDVGTATVVVKGINGYTGTVKKTFKITAYDIDKDEDGLFAFGESVDGRDTITAEIPYAKGGSKLTDQDLNARFSGLERILEQGMDYTLSYKGNTKVGTTASVTIKGKGNFKGTIKNVPFTIVPQSLATLNKEDSKGSIIAGDILEKNAKKYNKVIPVITDTNGKKLKNKTDFVIETEDGSDPYSVTGFVENSIPKAGAEVTVHVKGINNYTGTTTTKFKVIANDKNISSLKVTIDEQTYTGNPVELTGEAFTFKLKKEEVPLVEGRDFEIVKGSYINNIKKGTAKVTIRGKGDYGGTKTVTFKIKAKPMSPK